MPSTVIRDIHYDADTSRLVIQFKSGRRYAYFDVPPDVYADMQEARSRGGYFNARVRDRYSYSRLGTRTAAENRFRESASAAGKRLLSLFRPGRSDHN